MFTEIEREYCYRIWGGVPTDVEWAKSTLVWKNFIDNLCKINN